MKIQRWRPDTCQCVIDEELVSGQAKKLAGVVIKCAAHQDVADVELYDLLYAAPDSENRVKNEIHMWLLEQPDLSDEITDEDNRPRRKLKPGLAFNWRFEGSGRNRTLVVNGIGPMGQAVKALTGGKARTHPHSHKVRFE